MTSPGRKNLWRANYLKTDAAAISYLNTYMHGNSFCNMITENSLFQMNNVISNKHGSLLDLMFTTEPNLVDEPVECPIDFDTDHSILTFKLNLSGCNKRKISRVVYNFKQADFSTLRSLITNSNRSLNTSLKIILPIWTKLGPSGAQQSLNILINVYHGYQWKIVLNIHGWMVKYDTCITVNTLLGLQPNEQTMYRCGTNLNVCETN